MLPKHAKIEANATFSVAFSGKFHHCEEWAMSMNSLKVRFPGLYVALSARESRA